MSHRTSDGYRHTQTSPVRMDLLGVALLAAAAVLDNLVLAIVGVVVGSIGFLFGRLTVSVDDERIECRFGFGPIRIHFDAGEVTAVEIVRNRWWYGWGIRRTPRGWMWNVAGLDAVAFTRTGGESFVIGTDEPESLCAAIRHASNLNEASLGHV